jgi:hypothetical protein
MNALTPHHELITATCKVIYYDIRACDQINLKTAQMLSIDIPATLHVRSAEVIE